VQIGLKADVFFKVSDAEKVLLRVSKEKVVALVRDTAVATLNSIIRNTTLGEVAQNKEVAARSQKGAQLFFDRVHDEFISKLHESFNELFGIEITNIRIESFRLVDQVLANNISQQAIMTAQTHTQLSNLKGQTEIAIAQQKEMQKLIESKLKEKLLNYLHPPLQTIKLSCKVQQLMQMPS